MSHAIGMSADVNALITISWTDVAHRIFIEFHKQIVDYEKELSLMLLIECDVKPYCTIPYYTCA